MERKRQRSPTPPVSTPKPMSDLQIDDDSVLHNTNERHKCPKCDKPVKYFCYHCFDVVGMNRSQVPTVKLPVHLDVIKHEKELDGKSTAIHARVLAPEDVSLYGYGEIPTYEHPERTLLLFPGPNAKTLNEIPRDSFDRIVVLDGTWRQATRMARETPQLQGLQQITITPRKTLFWRFQHKKKDEHLATIEAIYYTYREYAEAYESENGARPYHGQYDNLMFYYRFFYNLIQNRYKNNHTRTFNPRHRENYIQYDNESGKPGDLVPSKNKQADDKSEPAVEKKKQKVDNTGDDDGTKGLDG